MVKFNLNTRSPEVREMLIAQLDFLGEKTFESQWAMPARTVREWRKLRNTFGNLSPRYSHRGQPKKLSQAEVARMEKKLVADPYATNEELAKVVKNKISPREAGRIIAQSPLQFKWKLEQEDMEASFSQANYEAGVKFINMIRHVPLNKRVYIDETRISSRVTRRRGRFPKGSAPHSPKNVKYSGHVVICAIKNKTWLHPGIVMKKGGMTTEEFESYVKKTLKPLLNGDETVLWDRWGKSGRALNPTAHHFSPKARATIESTGAQLELLPPTGKLLDPIEPLFGDTKRIYFKKLGALTAKILPSKVTFEQKKQFWREAELAVKSSSFERAYKMRANGKEFYRVARERGLGDK